MTAVGPLRCDELPIPPHDCVRRHNRRDTTRKLPTERLPLLGQPPALTFREPELAAAELLLGGTVLLDQAVDRALLLAADPTNDGGQQGAEPEGLVSMPA